MPRSEDYPFTILAWRPNGAVLEQGARADRVCRRARLYARLMPADTVIAVRPNCPVLRPPGPPISARVRLRGAPDDRS